MAGPSANELQRLVEQIAARVGQVLERRGLIERDIDNAWLAGDFEAGPLDDLIGQSITYRFAVGPRAGQELFTLQTVPARLPEEAGSPNGAARAGGFSLHAGVAIAANEREQLERLSRYVSRPPVAEDRLALPPSGHVRYALKTRYRDGTARRAGAAAADAAATGHAGRRDALPPLFHRDTRRSPPRSAGS